MPKKTKGKEAVYSYSISGSIDQGNDSGINHELKLINNHKNYIHLESYTQTHRKQCMHFKSSTHIQNNIVQQKHNIHLEISSLHSKRSTYTSTQIQNNIV